MRPHHRLIPFLLIASCGIPFPRYEEVDEAIAGELRARLECPAPTDAVIDLRGVLTHAGSDTSLLLRVFRKAPDRIRVNAVGHFGGTAFHAIREGGETSILRRSPSLSENLIHNLVADLEVMLLATPRNTDVVVRLEDGQPALLRRSGPTRTLLAYIHGTAPIDLVYQGSADLHMKLNIDWLDGRQHEAWLEDYAADFKMGLRVTAWQAQELEDSHFVRPR